VNEEPFHAALREAAERGWAVLGGGGSALDAVEAAVVLLEDDPLFNAGRGAVLNAAGQAEHDAAVMDGSTGRAGGIAAVRGIRNPVVLARAVMERTPHVLLAGAGAEAVAEREDIERVDPAWHVTEHRHRQWSSRDTVGAVAVDAHGHVAAATSTGGIARKLAGRIGDSPIPGAGVYADDATCAVSMSGAGEAILQAVASHRVAALVEFAQVSLEEAVARAVAHVRGEAGLIAVDPAGGVAIDFNTQIFHRAVRDADGLRTAVRDDWR
jgi:beta-aspartyl-peptidase (threonine type)